MYATKAQVYKALKDAQKRIALYSDPGVKARSQETVERCLERIRREGWTVPA